MENKIDLKQYLTSSGKYNEREAMADEQVITNATALLEKVNSFLEEIGRLDENHTVSSGFRPADVNAQVKNAAKKSAHMIGNAIDLLDDKEQTLGKLIKTKPELLKKYGLWLENPDHTKGQWSNWVHLDVVKRSDRALQMFNP